MNSKSNTLLNIIIFLLALLLFSSFRDQTTTSVDFGDDALTLGASNDFTLTIEYDEIVTVELVEQIDPGTAVSGDENRMCRWGTWENDMWGQYTLCTLKKIDSAILLTTLDNETVVFNLENEDTTIALQQMFAELLAHQSETESAA